MNSTELLDLFRKDVKDTALPYLWSDDEVLAYMNDAYYMFVRLTDGVPDFSNDAVCKLTTTALQASDDLHPSIMTIRMATRESDGTEIRIINAQDVRNLSSNDFGVIRSINMNTTPGRVSYGVIGMEQDTIRWVQIPDVVENIRLLVDRLPIEVINDFDMEFSDVKPHHHIHLLKWMKHLAYNKQDSETFDKARSEKEKKDFELYCSMAMQEKERYKHKVRVVSYGGI